MSQWEYVVIIYDITEGGGYKAGRVRYPSNYRDQDINQILNLLGQAGWEVVSSHVGGDLHAVITLQHQQRPPQQ
jgi:hypothetical protein